MANDKTNNAAGEQAKCLPRHIAIILDGNGRWAKKRGLPRTAGHAAGAESFRTIGLAFARTASSVTARTLLEYLQANLCGA